MVQSLIFFIIAFFFHQVSERRTSFLFKGFSEEQTNNWYKKNGRRMRVSSILLFAGGLLSLFSNIL